MKILYNFSVKSMKIICTLVCMFLAVISILNRAYIPQTGDSHVQYFRQSPLFYLSLIVFLVFAVFIKYFMDKISDKKLFTLLSIIYFAAGLFLIFSTNGAIRSDQGDAYRAARQANKGIFVCFETGREMFTFTHNLGIMSLFRMLISIYDSTRTIYCFNLIMIIIANYFLYKTADIVFDGNKSVNKYTVLFSFLFVQQLFYTLYAYGNVPGYTGLCAMFYFCARFYKKEKIDINVVAAVAFAVFSVTMKSNYIIGIIAAVILLSLLFMRKPSGTVFFMVALLVVSAVIPQKVLVRHYEKMVGHKLPGDSKISYVAMGLQEGKQGRGWYNSYNINLLKEHDYNVTLANEAALENIAERLEYFSENTEYTYNFFSRKIISTWCEPTFQCIKSGPSNNDNRKTKSEFLKNIYYGEGIYGIMYLYCNVITVSIFLLASVYGLYSVRKRNENLFGFFPLLFLTGGFLFHIFWGVKSRYVYMYVACLSPVAAMGLHIILDLKKNKFRKIDNNTIRTVVENR